MFPKIRTENRKKLINSECDKKFGIFKKIGIFEKNSENLKKKPQNIEENSEFSKKWEYLTKNSNQENFPLLLSSGNLFTSTPLYILSLAALENKMTIHNFID